MKKEREKRSIFTGLSFYQLALTIYNGYVGNIGCEAESNIINKTKSFYETVVVCEFGGVTD